MQIEQLIKKNINLYHNGIVKAEEIDNETVFVELDKYVVTNELKEHIENFFKLYMTPTSSAEASSPASKSGIWLSGSFGSGKSHFIKILAYLIQNIEVTCNGFNRTAFDMFAEKLQPNDIFLADIEKAIKNENKVILFDIDKLANTDDKEDVILKVLLKMFNAQLGYCATHAHIAHFERDLDRSDKFDAFKQAFNTISGENWLKERDAYDFYRDDIAEALTQVTEQSLDSAQQQIDKLEESFHLDITHFCKWVKEYLDGSPKRRLLFFIDGVGQFMGNNKAMMLQLQTITESLSENCNGKAWVVVTAHDDIDTVIVRMEESKSQDLSKVKARFEHIYLSESNTKEVIQKMTQL
ncbi:hypothetical protein [Shewanella japonica]|uniref:BREX system P-loop protein BrxC n=1 Tax=Shewanella japonica TaxID=93973 RepID=A0ABN4YMC7_9GAMM|nr:hypothetical protein [Shewanella japonica]ARD23590.1 hypothetical protein SJ2017_3331 [Shewanella japonica]